MKFSLTIEGKSTNDLIDIMNRAMEEVLKEAERCVYVLPNMKGKLIINKIKE